MRKPLIKKTIDGEYNFYRDGVTQSMLQTWKSCRQLAQYQLQGWHIPTASRKVAEFGSLVHKALELYYGIWGGAFYANKSEGIRAFCDRYRIDQFSEGKLAPEDIDYNATVCEALVSQYMEYWADIDAGFDWVSQEQVFDVPWGKLKADNNEPLTRLRGKIDGVLCRGANKRLWLFETKTKGQVSPDTLSKSLCFDFQNLFYITAYEQITSTKVFGTVYNILRPPQLRIKKNETPRDFVKRIQADIAERPEHYFFRMEIPYSPRQKEIFKKQLCRQLRDFEHWWNMQQFKTYRNEGNCTAKWTCEYLPICATGKFSGFERTKKLFSELEDDK